MERGVPQPSGKAPTQVVTDGNGVKKPPGKQEPKAGARSRSGPIDPRTEEANGSGAAGRGSKSLWRRAGASLRSTVTVDEPAVAAVPADFAAALPLAAPASESNGAGTTHATVTEPAPPPTEPLVVPDAAPPAVWAPTEPVEQPAPTTAVPTLEPTAPKPIVYDQAASLDDVTMIGPVLDQRPLRRPIHFRRAPRPRVRRVTRVLRHVDTWSVFKVALVFSLFFYAVSLIAGVLLWQVAYATGTIDNVEKFFEGFGWETFKFNGGQIFHNAWIAGLFVAMGVTGFAVLIATMFNLITDLVGGIRLSVLEEEVRPREERGTAPAPVAPMLDPTMDDDATGTLVMPAVDSDTATESMSVESG